MQEAQLYSLTVCLFVKKRDYVVITNSSSGDCGWEQFVLGLLKPDIKRATVLKFSVSYCENMFVLGNCTKAKLEEVGFSGNLDQWHLIGVVALADELCR